MRFAYSFMRALLFGACSRMHHGASHYVFESSSGATRPASPWHDDPVPAEEALGVDLSAAPIVGEPHEIALSEARCGAGTPTALGEAKLGSEAGSDDVETTSLPSKSRRRKKR